MAGAVVGGRARAVTLAFIFGLAFVAVLGALVSSSTPGWSSEIIEYGVPDPLDVPAAVAIGPDGAVWFTLESSDALGVLRNGQIRKLSKGGETLEGLGLAVDASGVWFTDISGQSIGHLLEDGTRDSVPVPGPLAQLGRLAIAPDGAVWFADSWGNSITRIADRRLVAYPAREQNAAPFGVAVDKVGTVWATLQIANKLVRIDPDGQFTELDLPTRNATPTDIAIDASGAVWFTELRANKIGRFQGGRFDEFRLPSEAPGLTSLAVAPDGSVWFTELRDQKLGRLRDGSIVEYALPRQDARPFGVTVAGAGDVWYTDLSGWVGMLPARRAQAQLLNLWRAFAWLRD